MKKLVLAAMLSIAICFSSFAQEEPFLDFHAATLSLCKESFHVYLDFNTNPYWNDHMQVNSPISTIVVYPSNDPTKRRELRNIHEVEFFNLEATKGEIPFTVSTLDKNGNLLSKREIRVGTKKVKGIVDVSEKLNRYLDGFSESKQSIITYFCNIPISGVQLLAFFQDFLHLSPEQICDLLDLHNQVMGAPLENWDSLNNMEITTTTLTCGLLNAYLESLTTSSGGGEPAGGGDDCACNLIRTNSSALNASVGQNSQPTDSCKLYSPSLFAYNYDPDGADGDDDLIFSYGRLGAAKAGAVELFYDGSDDSPDWSADIAEGYSMLRFRSVCVNPNTLDPDLSNCSACRKKVEVEYAYSSNIELFAKSMTCVLCPQKAEVTVEDWAMLVMQHNNNTQIVQKAARSHQAVCEFDTSEATIQTVLTDLPGVVTAVSNAIGQFNVANVVTAATEVISFLENSFIEDACNAYVIKHYTLLVGDTTVYLNPGEQVVFTLISNATFGGKIVNHGVARGKLNSDFRMAGVLGTLADENGTVPEYCDCEKIASYVVGAMNPFEPSTDFIIDEPDNEQTDWTSIFENAPLGGLYTMQQLVGSFIGVSGYWGDAFELGCCDDVVIPCHSDCVFLRGCDGNPIIGKMSGSGTTPLIGFNFEDLSQNIQLATTDDKTNGNLVQKTRKAETSKLQNVSSVRVFPNPIDDKQLLNIVLDKGFSIAQAQLFDLSGRLIQTDISYNDNTAILHTHSLENGTYLLYLKDAQANIYLKQIIKK